MRVRHRWIPWVVPCALALAACGPEERGADQVILRPNGDLLAAGETIDRAEAVAGDAMLVGGTVSFDGEVGGSYLGAGGEQRIRGRIEGSVRVGGGSVHLGASVGRNVTAAGGTVELLEGARVERNAYLAGGRVLIDGDILGDLYVGAGEVVLNGTVGGDVRVESGTLRVGPTARIDGELRYRLGGDVAPSIDPGASIGVVHALPAREEPRPNRAAMYLLRLFAFLVSAGVLVALLPGPATAMVDVLRARPLPALGFGVLWVVGVPVAAVILGVTLVGLPLALLLLALYLASIYMAPAIPALWLGGQLVAPRGTSIRSDRVRAFLVGGPILGIAILLPWVGMLVRIVAGLLGLGALALVLFRRSR